MTSLKSDEFRFPARVFQKSRSNFTLSGESSATVVNHQRTSFSAPPWPVLEHINGPSHRF